MKIWTKWAAVTLLLLFSGSAMSQDDAKAAISCGMEEVAGQAGAQRVKAGDPTICPEDVAFQGFYVLWSEVFQDPLFESWALLFVDETTLKSPFTVFASEQIGIGQMMYFVLSSISMLLWPVFGTVLAYKSWPYIKKINDTGKIAFGDNQGDTVRFVSYFTFLLVLMMPAGLTGGKDGKGYPITLGQGAAIVGALPAFMGGNYIFSTNLAAVNTASTDVSLAHGNQLPDAQSVANAMVETQLCQARTRQALMAINGRSGTEFFKDARDTNWFGLGSGNDQTDILKRYDMCLSYYGSGQEESFLDGLKSLSIDKRSGENYDCGRRSDWGSDSANYKPEQYGESHRCGKVSYNMDLDKFSETIEKDGVEDSLERILEAKYASTYFKAYKNKAYNDILGVLRRDDLSSEERYAAVEKVILAASTAFDPVFEKIDNGNPTNDVRQVQFMVTLNALLGGTIDKDAWDRIGETMSTKISRQYYGLHGQRRPNNEVKEELYGVDTLLEEAREIAMLMQRYQCALEWGDHSDSRLYVTKFNQASNEEELESLLSSDGSSLQCVEFLHKEKQGNTALDKYARYPVLDSRANADITQKSGLWVLKSPSEMSAEEHEAVSQYMATEVAGEYYQEMQARQLTLAGYVMAAKVRTAEKLTSQLSQDDIETQQDSDLRKKGWGIYGGALLYWGQSKTGAQHMSSSIEGVFNIEAPATGLSYVAKGAFAPEKYEESAERIEEMFTPVPVSGLFVAGPMGTAEYPGPGGISDEDKEDAEYEILLNIMEWAFLEPIGHIKMASGMREDATLATGLKECYDNGAERCLSGTKHPLVAMSHFGSDLMDNMMMLLLIENGAKFVNRVILDINSETGDINDGMERAKKRFGRGKGKVKDLWNKGADFVKDTAGKAARLLARGAAMVAAVLAAVSIAAELILGALSPIIITLFAVGAFFAYIVPMMAFLYGFMMVLLTFVGFTVVAFVLPFYVIMQLLKIEQTYQRGFQEFYEKFLGPYLTPLFFGLAAALSFAMVSVSMFALNTTFSLLYEGVGSGGTNSFSGFTLDLMMYIVYFVCLFVLFRWSLAIMKTMPDMLKEKLKLERGNDSESIDSLGMEAYVTTQAMRSLAEMPKSMQNALKEHAAKQGRGSLAEYERRVAEMETLAAKLDAMDGGGPKPPGGGGGNDPSRRQADDDQIGMNDVPHAPDEARNEPAHDESPVSDMVDTTRPGEEPPPVNQAVPSGTSASDESDGAADRNGETSAQKAPSEPISSPNDDTGEGSASGGSRSGGDHNERDPSDNSGDNDDKGRNE